MATRNYAHVPEVAPELGVFFVLSVVVCFAFLHKVRGNLKFVDAYLSARPWPFMQDSKALAKFLGLFRFIISCILTWPAFTLIAWTVVVLFNRIEDDGRTGSVLGVSVFLISLMGILGINSVLTIAWRRFRMTRGALWSLIGAGVCFVTFQLYVEFMLEPSFFGISAIFLSLNLIIVIIIVFLTQSEGGVSIVDVINDLEPGEPIQYPPDSKTLAEVMAEESQSDFKMTQTHIYDLFTLERSADKKNSPVGGGLQYLFTRGQSGKAKAWVFIVGYLLALIDLGAYCVLTHFTTSYGYLGILNSVCLVCLDLVIYFYVYARLSQGPLEASLVAFSIRLFIVSKC
jgi:hypothetical protein